MHKQYDRLIAARNYHYDNLNKWLMSFYVILGALFVALWNLHGSSNQHRYMELLIAIVGYVVSIAGLLSGKGYFYWEMNWIRLLQNFERRLISETSDRVYSILADREFYHSLWKPICGAKVSTSKVFLLVTAVVATIWGMIVIYFTFNLQNWWWNGAERFGMTLFSLCLSTVITLILMIIGSRFLQSKLDYLDDLQLDSNNKGNEKNKKQLNDTNRKENHMKCFISRCTELIKKNKLTILIISVIVFVIISIVFSLCLYSYHFNGGMSTEHNYWGEFGDYISGIAGILNVIAFVVLTISLHFMEQSREVSSKRLHAEEVVAQKIQMVLTKYTDYYIQYQKDQSKTIARETFHYLQPLMAYLYYLKESKIIPLKTKQQIKELHEYLFEASESIFNYAYDVVDKKQEPQQMIKVLNDYRQIYQKLNKLEVTMIADISDLSQNNDSPDYIEQPDKEKILIEKLSNEQK